LLKNNLTAHQSRERTNATMEPVRDVWPLGNAVTGTAVTVICRSSTLGNSQPHTDLDTVMGTMVVEEGRGGDGRAQRLKVCAIANQVWPKP